MTVYRLSPEFFRWMQRRTLLIAIPMLTVAALVGIGVSDRGKLSTGSLITMPLIAVAGGWGVRNGMKQQRQR